MKLKLNKFTAVALSALLVFGLSGCNNKTEESKDKKTSTESKVFEGKYIKQADYVKEKLKSKDVIFVDCRGEEGLKGGKTVPNAIVMQWQDLADVATKKPGDKGWGHMLPKADLEKKLSDLGLDKNKEIILFSTGKAGWGEDGRILWALNACGYENVLMIDGGIEAIETSGIELGDRQKNIAKADVKIDKVDYKNTINTDELTRDIKNYKIVDTREKDEYDGATKYGEAKGGHIEGAINIPYSSLYNKDGKLKSNDEIKKLFEEAGLKSDDKIVTYCTGGIRSAFMQLMFEMSGYNNVKNYEGSYYNWAKVNPVVKK